MFSISDEDLFRISRFEGGSFWERLQAAAGDGAPSHWEFAISRLRDFEGFVGNTSLAGLARQCLHHTGYLSILSVSNRAVQSIINIDKFLDLLRDFERNGRKTIREFLEFLDSLAASGAAEPESLDLESAGKAVRIYTIHGAKGLQFPVVLLPELGTPFSNLPSDQFYFQRLPSKNGDSTFLSFKIWNPEDRYKTLRHPAYTMLKRLGQYRQIAEEKRLLYVATTRAQDRLILIGKDTPRESFARWILDSTASPKQLDQEDLKRILSLPFGAKEDTLFSTPHSSSTASYPSGLPATQSGSVPGRGTIHTKTIWTPTEIALFQSCPKNYYLSRQVRASEGEPFAALYKPDHAALVGTAVHDLLEKAALESRPGGLDPHLRVWRSRLEGIAKVNPEALIQEIQGHLKRTLESTFYERLQTSAQRFSERPFNILFEGRTIRGVIDTLFQKPTGGWVVVDFKTNRIRSDRVTETVEHNRYDLQLQLYMWAVSKVMETNEIEGFLYFTASGELIHFDFDSQTKVDCEGVLRKLPGVVSQTEFPRTKDSSLCQTCDYMDRGLCQGAGIGQLALWKD
jgi:ATP-dependent helicase/nuclease subunit A